MAYIYEHSFEKLMVWKKSKELVKLLYNATKQFPADEKYGLVSQIRRAAISIPTNLAEGSARKTAKDQAHFSTIAYGSLMELLNLIIISFELGYVSEELFQETRGQVREISMMLNALRNTQIK